RARMCAHAMGAGRFEYKSLMPVANQLAPSFKARIHKCSLPSPSLKPACSGVELPAHSFCHAHCWNLPPCCSEAITCSPCYWTPRLFGGNRVPFPFLHN
ncbi:mCG1026215, partial [Mus musculus]